MSRWMICQAAAPLLLEPCREAEMVDEALYGMEVQVLETLPGGWAKVRMPYEYSGYISRDALVEAEEYRPDLAVYSAQADVLWEPEYRKRPMLSLPRGARLASAGAEDGRFLKVRLADGSEGFMHRNHAGPLRPWSRDRSAVVETAKQYLGAPYRWGGKTPGGIDCSGLCFMAFWLNGKTVYRDAVFKEDYMRPVSLEEARPGDCLYFPGHVAMYLGKGLFIHSNTRRGGVTINSLDPEDPAYAPELSGRLLSVGSAF